jgi:peptidoglycan/LPS O-acetylase OafA/YrhL
MPDLHLPEADRRLSLPDRWPPRRWVVVALAAPALTWLLVTVAPVGPAAPRGAAWWFLVLATALAGSGTLASYVPASGRRVELGCSPCAMVSVLTVLGAVLVVRGSGGDPAGPVLALAVALFGLGQRLAQPPVCPTVR